MGEFTHHQHLVGVSVVYASASLAGERIVLTGEPRPSAGDASSGDSYTSRARVSIVIPNNTGAQIVRSRISPKGSLRGGGYSREFSSSRSRTIHRCSFKGVSPRPYAEQYDNDADVVLVGHDHIYEHFAPQNPDGAADPKQGIREFVVGTGGASLHAFGTIKPNSELRNNDTHGVLKLTLKAEGYALKAEAYEWEFVPVAGKIFTDSGSNQCH